MAAPRVRIGNYLGDGDGAGPDRRRIFVRIEIRRAIETIIGSIASADRG